MNLFVDYLARDFTIQLSFRAVSFNFPHLACSLCLTFPSHNFAILSPIRDLRCKDEVGIPPNSFFMVIPFVREIRRWIRRKKNLGNSSSDDEQVSPFFIAYDRFESDFQEYIIIRDHMSLNIFE